MSTFTAHIVARCHISSPATIYVDVHDTYCRPLSHIVAGDNICSNSCVCQQGGGGGGGGGGVGGGGGGAVNRIPKLSSLSLSTDRQKDRADFK